MWKIGENKLNEEDIELLIEVSGKPFEVAYAYLEPFIEIEKYYKIIVKFNKAGIHKYLYTNGILATEEELMKLGEIGLDEIRFNLGASQCSNNVINNIKIAKKYIKYEPTQKVRPKI